MPGEQKLKNLSDKINHAAMMGILERLDEDINRRFTNSLIENLDMEEIPAWIERSDVQEIIISSMELDDTFKGIVSRILKRRASTLPWDFRDEPANEMFVEKMKSNNINITPWIDGVENMVKVLPDGSEIIFCIERDPIEVFSMGRHFRTCLSPGGVNFFSVFANIIDINKQVVYGKTRNGSVRARALIALTDEGGLLTFHPYCNYGKLDFENILKEFVHDLALKMNTVVLAKGTVSKLVAPDWYDDGPRDLTEEFSFAREGSDFRKGILEWDADKILSNMEIAVEPIGLNELTIPLFIHLPEIKQCSKLVDILFTLILRSKSLSTDSICKYAEILLENGRFEMLERLIPKIVENALHVGRNDYYWSLSQWIELLLKISPVKALYVLKKTRTKNNRTWEDDEGERIAAAARAYLKLNRPKQAARLFSMAIEGYISIETKSLCLMHLKELNLNT